MVILNDKEKAFSEQLYGKVGRPTELGNFWFGYSEIGDDDAFSGVYQRRRTKQGFSIVKMRYSMPPYVNTPIQQARRSKFADAVASWNELPFENQIVWNKKKYPLKMSGYNRYISWYMQQN